MPPPRSRDRFGDDDDYVPPRRKNNTALIVVLVLAGVCLVAVAGCIGMFALGVSRVQQAAEEEQAREVERQAKEKSLPTRDEFRAKVMGKTPDEVTDLVGKPDSIAGASGASGGVVTWTYRNVSRDPVTGKTDGPVSVHFRNGRVEKVDF
jgi:hypothetical protein